MNHIRVHSTPVSFPGNFRTQAWESGNQVAFAANSRKKSPQPESITTLCLTICVYGNLFQLEKIVKSVNCIDNFIRYPL